MATDIDLEAQEAELDMTPMIDVTFLLIIFFMVVSDMSALDVEEVALPYGDKAYKPDFTDTEENPTLIVNVVGGAGRPGQVKIRGENYKTFDNTVGGMGLKEFLKLEAEAVGREPADPNNPGLKASKLRVYIRADKDLAFKYVQTIFDACSKNGIYKTALGASQGDTKD